VDKVSVSILSFLLGVIIVLYTLPREMPYRISFYGYNKDGTPIVKLRRNIYGKGKMFHRLDEGLSMEIGNSELRIGKSMEFTDEQVDKIIKERYCK